MLIKRDQFLFTITLPGSEGILPYYSEECFVGKTGWWKYNYKFLEKVVVHSFIVYLNENAWFFSQKLCRAHLFHCPKFKFNVIPIWKS